MDTSSFLTRLAEVLEVEPGSISETTLLNETNWDSLAMLGTIGLIDSDYGVTIPTDDLRRCAAVKDILDLIRQATA